MKSLEKIYDYLRITANLISQSRFGNQIILKGGSVLMSKLIECGRTDLERITRDLGIHCDKKEVWVDFYSNIEAILNQNTFGYVYKLIDRRSITKGLDTSDSLKFELYDSALNKTIEFKMDMNIKSNMFISCEYSPILNLTTYDLPTSISDKIVVVSSKKIFRRVKDLYDIAVMCSISSFSYNNILQHLEVKHKGYHLDTMLIPMYFEDISHAYNAYRGIENKPSIENLIGICSSFLQPFYVGYSSELIWNYQTGNWVQS